MLLGIISQTYLTARYELGQLHANNQNKKWRMPSYIHFLSNPGEKKSCINIKQQEENQVGCIDWKRDTPSPVED